MTYAVVKTGGKQYKAQLGEVLTVEKLEVEVGACVELPVLFSPNGKVKAVAEVIEHGKGPKVIIFKKKRRNNYRRKNGHRQPLTTIQIVELGGEKLDAAKKKVAKARPVHPTPKADKNVKAEKPAKAAKPAKTQEPAAEKATKAKKAPAKKSTTKKTEK
jgi:large subunit ribosomal protein L21